MYVQQQQQPMYQAVPMQQMQPMQQMPMQQMQMQPMQMQMQPMQMQQQPMMMQVQQQPVYVQPQVMVQPVMQPVIQVTQPFMNTGMMPNGNQPSFDQIQNVLKNIKEAVVFTVKYMEPNFRGNGGYKFGIYGRDKANPFAYGYTTTKGDASIELVDFAEPFPVTQVSNNSVTLYNPQNGQKDLIGTLGLTQGSCNGFQIAAEKGGNRKLVFQNRQFSFLFCVCCSLLYLLHLKCCTDKTKFQILEGEGEEYGTAEYKTDEIKSFRELDVSLLRGNDLEKNTFAILQSLLYMNKKVLQTSKSDGDVSFEF